MAHFEVIYGRNPVREALRGGREVRRVWLCGRVAEGEWPDRCRQEGVEVVITTRDELDRIAGTGEHQSVACEVEPMNYVEAEMLFQGESPLIVTLDQVQDPHNLGAVARVAECAGAAGLVIPERRSVGVTPAVCSASAGAIEHIPIARVRNVADFLAGAKQKGGWVYGASAQGEVQYTEVDYNGIVVVVLGSEGKGLRPRVAKACDSLISIAMHGKLDSLNVSTAAAIVLFEAARQRSGGQTPFRL